jgi:glycerate kinase
MRVLVCPDKFRGTLTAAEAARAIAAGWRRARPGDTVDELPLADGGEGTLETLMAALGGELRTARVSGPLGDPVDAAYGIAGERPGPTTAVVEMARASGLPLVSPSRRDAARASSRGTGELVLAACRAGAERVVVCLGGSASTDGGTGLAAALGARFLDARGRELPDGGGALEELERIDVSGLDRSVRAAELVAACDVDSPLTGAFGAARVFAPQKGASPEQILRLEAGLARLAAIVRRDLGLDLAQLPRAGAAGGTAGGLAAFCGAHLRSGAEVVFEAVRFSERLAGADLVVTGEGRFDETSLAGKVVGGALGAARRLEVPALVLCGDRAVGSTGVEVHALVERYGRERALGDARRALEDLAAFVGAEWRPVSSPP